MLMNYSSFRGGWLEFQRSISYWQRSILVDQICRKVAGWFLDHAKIFGYKTNGVSVNFTPPSREMIDPAKEIPPLIDAMRAGISSWSSIQRSRGKNPEETAQELNVPVGTVRSRLNRGRNKLQDALWQHATESVRQESV